MNVTWSLFSLVSFQIIFRSCLGEKSGLLLNQRYPFTDTSRVFIANWRKTNAAITKIIWVFITASKISVLFEAHTPGRNSLILRHNRVTLANLAALHLLRYTFQHRDLIIGCPQKSTDWMSSKNTFRYTPGVFETTRVGTYLITSYCFHEKGEYHW